MVFGTDMTLLLSPLSIQILVGEEIWIKGKAPYDFFIRNYLITWMNQKQNSISLSTIKVNYITIGSCYMQLLQ